jgi:hypothetical protein
MLKLTFTKTPTKGPGLGQSWTHTVEPPDAAMEAEYLNLSPRSQFIFRYGWKQKLVDSTSSCTNEQAFIGAVNKNRDSVVNGTVTDRDGVAAKPMKTPIEREIERLATIAINEAIADGPNAKMSTDKKAAYIELYAETHDDELREKAKANMAGSAKVRTVSADDLAALFAAKGIVAPATPKAKK